MTTDALRALDGERYLSLETYRKDGSAVLTPVWFAHLDGTLVVMTQENTFKVKRLRRNDKIRVAACSARGKVRGEFFDGTGEVVEDPELETRAFATLKKRYGLQWRLITLLARVSGRRKGWVALQLHV